MIEREQTDLVVCLAPFEKSSEVPEPLAIAANALRLCGASTRLRTSPRRRARALLFLAVAGHRPR